MNRQIVYLFLLVSLSVSLPCCTGNREGQGIPDPYIVIAKHIASQKTSDALLKETQKILDSLTTASPESLRPTVQAICRTLVNGHREKEAISVVALAHGIEETQHPEIASRLLTATLLPGIKAPPITGLTPAQGNPNFTLLLFHESSCRSCGNIIWEMREQYRELQNNGTRVVTISTDTDKEKWTEYATKLPWQDKLCDYKGFYSPAMTAYGVAATPTFYLIDEKGMVVDQYATFDEAWKVIVNGK